jgi:membrane dipeptidase
MTPANNAPPSPIAVDLHGDLLMDVIERRRIYGETRVLLTHHYEKLRAARVKVQVLPIYIEYRYQPELSLRHALLQFAALYQELAEGAGEFRLIQNGQDLAQVLESDAIGVIFSFEGAEPFGRDVELVSAFHRLGLRMVGLTWNWANLAAQGAAEDTGAGLTRVGRRLVSELGRHGIMLDVSHLSPRSFWDTLERLEGPVLASHSNARRLCDHERNLDDDQIKAIAERDGLIGLNFIPLFVGEGDLLDGLAAHAAHIAGLVGARHVALGPDFIDYLKYRGQPAPKDQLLAGGQSLEDLVYAPSLRLVPEFHATLLRRGFSKDDAAAIFNGNALRFLQANL